MLSFKSLGLDLRITHSLSLPQALYIPPGRPQDVLKNCFEASKLHLLVFQNALHILLRKNIDKRAKIKDLRYPKPSQNPSKMPSKWDSQKTCDFSSIFA